MNIEIVLTPTTGPIDEPLHGFVCGLPPGESVTVRAQLRDSRDLLWRSHVTLSAGDDGLATMHVDGLIASLTLSPEAARRPFDTTSALPLTMEFTAEYAGRIVAATQAQRLFVADDVLTMVNWCQVGPPRAQVSTVEVFEEHVVGETGFKIR